MIDNNRNEFKFVVTGVPLGEEDQERISRAIAQAGALALGDLAPLDSTSVRLKPNIWWHGGPRDGLMTKLQEFAAKEAGIPQ